MAEQSDPNQTRLQAVDSALLTPLVQSALNQEKLTLSDWQYKQVHGGFGGGMGGTFIYRFTGTASVQTESIDWSLILKIVRTRPDEAPSSTHYWKREAEVYRSGLLENLPGRLFAARCYRVDEYPGDACWIWQEDIQEGVRESWNLDDYEIVARHFGQFNGAYITTRPIPSRPWFGPGWLRKIVEAAASFVPQIELMLKHPSLHPAYPSDADKQFLRLWDERERFLTTLDKLPQTFAHQDPVRRNLFLRRASDGDYETIAVDWAYVGQAVIGMDIAVPFIINLAFMELDIAAAQDFDVHLYRGYLAGLRDAGWTGDVRQVRLGFAAAAACKHIEGLMLMSSRGHLTDPARHSSMEQAFGHPIQKIIEQAGGISHYVFHLADEARQIMDELGYP